MIQAADERQGIKMNGRCFQVWQISAGWFRGCITDSQTKIFFDNSWMTNFPEDLMLAILCTLGELPDEKNRTVFYAYGFGYDEDEVNAYIDDICKLLDGECEEGDAASTGEFAHLDRESLEKELARLQREVLEEAFRNYLDIKYPED